MPNFLLSAKSSFSLIAIFIVFAAAFLLLPNTLQTFAAENSLPSHSQVIGKVPVPPGTEAYNKANNSDFALIYFLSNIIKVITVVAGIWVVFNIVWAGFLYLTQSGKSSATEKVRNLLLMSAIGLLLIVTSYTLAGMVGLLVFGDASYIINPTISPTGNY